MTSVFFPPNVLHFLTRQMILEIGILMQFENIFDKFRQSSIFFHMFCKPQSLSLILQIWFLLLFLNTLAPLWSHHLIAQKFTHDLLILKLFDNISGQIASSVYLKICLAFIREDKRDLQALLLSGTPSLTTGTRPPSCHISGQPSILPNKVGYYISFKTVKDTWINFKLHQRYLYCLAGFIPL